MFQDNRIMCLGPGSGSFLDQGIIVDQEREMGQMVRCEPLRLPGIYYLELCKPG